MFADDTTIRATAKDITTATLLVQQHLNELSKNFAKWGLRVNAAKSEVICFTRRRTPSVELSLDGVITPSVSKLKYLGVWLQSYLKYTEQNNQALRKAKLMQRIF